MSEPTAFQSERLALVVATLGVAVLAVELADAGVALALLAGLGTAAALRYVDADDLQVAALARCVGALGLVGGVLGVFAAVALASGRSMVATIAVAAGLWTAVVAAVGVVAGSDADEQFRATAWTSSIAGVGVGLAAVTGLGSLVAGTSPTAGPAAWLWAFVRWLVTGGQPGSAIPILLAFLGVLCVVAAATPPTAPPRPQTASSRDDVSVERLDSLQVFLARSAVGFLLAAALLYLAPIAIAFPGPTVYVAYALRALFLVGIVALLAGAVAGSVVERWVWPDGRPLRGVALSVGSGTVAAVVLTVAVGTTARLASFEPWIGLAVVACVAVGTVPLLEAALRVSGLESTLRRHAVSVPAAALIVAATAATQVGATVAPVVAIGAALVVWDALSYRRDLRAEVFGADTAAIERRHLGATVGVVTVAVLLALAVAGVTSLVGRNPGGEPLVVVVTGALLLVLVTLALGRWNPT